MKKEIEHPLPPYCVFVFHFYSVDECFLQLHSSNHIHQDVRQKVISSLPHYGHSGIVEAARDLFMQIEGNLGDDGKTMLLFH